MPRSDRLTIESDLPSNDIVLEILERFELAKDVRFGWDDDYECEKLLGGMSGTLVLLLTAPARRLVMKIGRTPAIEREIESTKWFMRTIAGGGLVTSSDALVSHRSRNGKWTGFTLYEVAHFAGQSKMEPLSQMVGSRADLAAVAGHVGTILGTLNSRLYGESSHIRQSSVPQWFEPKLIPLALAEKGVCRTDGPKGSFVDIGRKAYAYDRNPYAPPFAFYNYPVDDWELSADRRRLRCWHSVDPNSRKGRRPESIEVELADPISVAELHRLVEHAPEPILVSGEVVSSRSKQYQAIFHQHGLPDVAALLPAALTSARSYWGGIHGDLHLDNILLIRDEAATVVWHGLIDMALAKAEAPLWWDYAKLEISLRRALLAEVADSRALSARLGALLDIVSASAGWADLPEDLVVRLWNEEHPQLPELPRPLLRLRAKAWELVSGKAHDRDLWLTDYQATLAYGGLVFLKYRHAAEFQAIYCDLAHRAWLGLDSGKWDDYPALGPRLGARVALALLSQLLHALDTPAAAPAASAALNALYRLDPTVVPNVLAREEPPNPTLFHPPDLELLSAEDVDLICEVRGRLRAMDGQLQMYRQSTGSEKSEWEKRFARLRGQYRIPLKARSRDSDVASFDVLSLTRGLPECVILGQPGSGKSTFADFRLVTNARDADSLPVVMVVPFFAWSAVGPTSTGVEAETTFLAHVAEQMNEKLREKRYPKEVSIEQVTSLCEAGAFLFVFDGLNELDQRHRQPFVEAVRGLRKRFPGNQILVTSRTLHYREEFEPWPTIVLEDLSEQEARNYIRQEIPRLTSEGDGGAADERYRSAERLSDQLFGERAPRGVRDLARTPMFLELVVKYFTETGKLPESRGILLKYVVDHSLASYTKKSGPDPVAPEVLEKALQHLAYSALSTESGQTERQAVVAVTRDVAIGVLQPVFGARRAGRTWTALLETGLLHGERDGSVATFKHQAFLEFFASLRLATTLRADPAAFVERAKQVIWQETLQTLVSYQVPETQKAIQAFLEITTMWHYDLVKSCVRSAEHIEPEVLDAILAELRRTIDDPSVTMTHRNDAADALASLAEGQYGDRARDELLEHVAGADVCPAAVRALVRLQPDLSKAQRRHVFSHMERLLGEGHEAVRMACVQALLDTDSSLSAVVALTLLEADRPDLLLPRRVLLRGLMEQHRITDRVLGRLCMDPDAVVTTVAVSALAEAGQPWHRAAAEAVIVAVETDGGLLRELAPLLDKAPSDLMGPYAKRWAELAMRQMGAAVAADGSHPAVTVLHRAVRSAPEGPWLPDAFSYRIPLPACGVLIKLEGVPVSERAAFAGHVGRTLADRSPIPDIDAHRGLLRAMAGHAGPEMTAAVVKLVAQYSLEPLWQDLPAGWYGERRRPMTAREKSQAISELASDQAGVWIDAWVRLRGQPSESTFFSQLAEGLGFDRPDILRRLSLLGHHSAKVAIPQEVLELIVRRLAADTTPVPSGPFLSYFGPRKLRYCYEVLAQNGHLSDEVRGVLFRSALRYVAGVGTDHWYAAFMAEKICNRLLLPIESIVSKSDQGEVLQLCRFFAFIPVSERKKFSDRLLARLKPFLDEPDKASVDDWIYILRAIGFVKARGSEKVLDRIANDFTTWLRRLRGGSPGSIAKWRLFSSLVDALIDVGSANVARLIFKHFPDWDAEGRKRFLGQLTEMQWPRGHRLSREWASFVTGRIDELAAPELLAQARELVGRMRGEKETAQSLGQDLRAIAADAARRPEVREAAEELITVLERNYDTLVPYDTGIVERLRAKLSGSGGPRPT